MRSGAAVERLRDQLRAEAGAEHRHAARMRVGDDLALALERRVAVGAVRVDDAAEHDQAVERARRRLGLRERVPRDGAHAERRDRRLERGQRRVEVVLDDEDGGIRAHARIFAHRRAGARRVAKVLPRCVRAFCWRWACSTSCGARRTSRSASPSRRCRRWSSAGIRFLLAGAARARRARGARPHRRAAVVEARSAARRSPGTWIIMRRRRRRHDHRDARGLEPHRRAGLDDVAVGRRVPRPRRRAHRPRRDRGRGDRRRRRDRAALAGRLRRRAIPGSCSRSSRRCSGARARSTAAA